LKVTASTQGGTLHLNLAAGDAHVRELLARQSFQLRRDLEAAGVDVGSLDVSGYESGQLGGRSGTQGDGGAGSSRGETSVPASDERPAAGAVRTRARTAAATGLDVLI
jgi:flagellar hook-length control protein FliK